MFVKICGITNEDDALLAVAMGADAVGFVFAPSSRQIAPTRAADIAKRLPPEILTVAVFRNESPKRVVELVNRHGFGCAQLHGHESPEDTEYVRQRVARILKAFTAGTEQLERAREWNSDPILVDGQQPGSGEAYERTLALGAPSGLRVVLAGGLDEHNVATAVAEVRPWGVDVSSGVEKSPGRKDPVKVREFVKAARSVDLSGYEVETDLPYDWRRDG